MVKRSAFAGCLAFYNKATPSVTTPKPASDAVTAPSRRRLKCGDSFRPFGTPSRAVETALGQETARSMCRFQVRKWSKPHRGFAKKALAHPQPHPKKNTTSFFGDPVGGAKGIAASPASKINFREQNHAFALRDSICLLPEAYCATRTKKRVGDKVSWMCKTHPSRKDFCEAKRFSRNIKAKLRR